MQNCSPGINYIRARRWVVCGAVIPSTPYSETSPFSDGTIIINVEICMVHGVFNSSECLPSDLINLTNESRAGIQSEYLIQRPSSAFAAHFRWSEMLIGKFRVPAEPPPGSQNSETSSLVKAGGGYPMEPTCGRLDAGSFNTCMQSRTFAVYNLYYYASSPSPKLHIKSKIFLNDEEKKNGYQAGGIKKIEEGE